MRILGIILAGGESKRMGIDKASIKIDGVSLLKNAFTGMQNCAEIVLAARNITLPNDLPEHVQIQDSKKMNGPLAGILSGLEFATQNGFSLVQLSPCDTPLVDENVFSKLENEIGQMECCVPKSESGLHPLHALIKTSSALDLFNSNKVGNSVKSLIMALEYNTIEINDEIMLNINTEQDLCEFN